MTESLAMSLRQGWDDRTAARLVEECEPLVRRVAAKRRIPGMDQDDVRQELRTVLVNSVRGWDPGRSSFAARAVAMMGWHALRLLHRAVRHSVEGLTGPGDPSWFDGMAAPDRDDWTAWARERTARALPRCDPVTRRRVEMLLSGVPTDAVAAEEGVSRQAVRGSVAKFRRALRG